MNNKHAYLIIASGQFNLLKKLINCLDYVDNDIYLHIDKKCKIKNEEFDELCKYSQLFFIERMKVSWGGTSLTKVSLNLLEEASKKHYKYYHLISGQDLPLKNQNEIHEFFDNSKKNFISLSELNGKFNKRIDHFYPLQNITSKHNIFNKIWHKIIVNVFEKLHIKRKRKYPVYGLGSQWFSITDDFAQYVISKKKEILKNFKMTLISDEIWLQTIWMNSPFVNSNSKYISHKHNEYIEEIYYDCVRAIDFTRGNPYVYKIEDYEYLMETDCMFARKFDENQSKDLIDKICNKVKQTK